MDSHTMLLMVGLIICLGIATYVLADRLSVPSIVLLLGVGIIAGPEVLGLIDPAEFGSGIRVLVPLLVAIIVFEGGIVLDINILRQISRPVQMLMSVGALITWGAAALVAHYVAGLQLPTAILFGALMSVTGPTVITPLMRRTNARERLKVLLQAEGVVVDAVGAILAVVVLNVIISQGTPFSGAVDWLTRIGIGTIVGLLGGIALAYALRFVGSRSNAETTRLSALGGAIAIFIVAEFFAHEAGIAAAAVSGIVVGNINFPHEEDVVHFKGDLTILSITIIFIILAARLRFADLAALGWRGVLAVGLMMVVVRPLNVFGSLIGTNLTMRERSFIAAVCPRGVVAASFATFAAIELEAAGRSDGNLFIGLVFMTVIGTVVIQGFTTPWMARWLGVEPMTTIIVGANELGLGLAKQLGQQGRDVTLIDTNSENVQAARQAQLSIVQADATNPDVLRKHGIERAEAVVVATTSDKVNVLISQIMRTQFNVENLIARADQPATAKALHDLGVKTMSPMQAAVTWLDHLVRGSVSFAMLNDSSKATVREVMIENPRLTKKPIRELNLPQNILVAMVRRNGDLSVPHGSTQLHMGDTITIVGTAEDVHHACEMMRGLDAEKQLGFEGR